MNIKVKPWIPSGNIQAIPSKSKLHRVLIASALAGEPSCEEILNAQGLGGDKTLPRDIENTISSLEQLALPVPIFDCGESGSTLRFMLPIGAALKEACSFKGSPRLFQRPLFPLVQEMSVKGVHFDFEQYDGLGFSVSGKLKGGEFTIPGDISSQFTTGLLFALPLLPEDSTVKVQGPIESYSYIKMTLEVLGAFGIDIKSQTCGDEDQDIMFYIKGGQRYTSPRNFTSLLEGDWSNSAFWLGAGLLNGGLRVDGLSVKSTQADKAFLSVATSMKGSLLTGNVGSCEFINCFKSSLKGIIIDGSQFPDLVPVLAVLAATAEGQTTIYNVGRLRFKESNRLKSIADGLNSLGANVILFPNKLIIDGVPALRGGRASGADDHRIVMAMAIASAASITPIIIEGAEAVTKSYPDFWHDFKLLGGVAHEV